MKNFPIWLIIIVFALVFIILLIIVYYCWRKYVINKQTFPKENKVESFTKDFNEKYWWNLYNNSITANLASLSKFDNIAGIYILINIDQHNKTYVGQTRNLSIRINQHFSDPIKSNKRVYKDVTDKNRFIIKVVVWNNTMPNLNTCESAFIRLLKSDSFYGYNRSLGRNWRNKEIVKRNGKYEEY